MGSSLRWLALYDVVVPNKGQCVICDVKQQGKLSSYSLSAGFSRRCFRGFL